jgi:hypothetical protein
MNWLDGFVSIAIAYRGLVLERIWVMRCDTRHVSGDVYFSPQMRLHFAIREGAKSVTSLDLLSLAERPDAMRVCRNGGGLRRSAIDGGALCGQLRHTRSFSMTRMRCVIRLVQRQRSLSGDGVF